MVGGVPDVITCAKFQIEIFMGYDFTGGRIFDFCIDFKLQKCSATALPVMMETVRGMAETIPDGSRKPRRHDGGMAVDDCRRRKIYGSDGAYTDATVCGGGGQGGCVKSYKRDCFLCQFYYFCH